MTLFMENVALHYITFLKLKQRRLHLSGQNSSLQTSYDANTRTTKMRLQVSYKCAGIDQWLKTVPGSGFRVRKGPLAKRQIELQQFVFRSASTGQIFSGLRQFLKAWTVFWIQLAASEAGGKLALRDQAGRVWERAVLPHSAHVVMVQYWTSVDQYIRRYSNPASRKQVLKQGSRWRLVRELCELVEDFYARADDSDQQSSCAADRLADNFPNQKQMTTNSHWWT